GTQDWNATKCVPAAPVPAQLGEPCHAEGSAVSGIDDCDAGLLCFGVDSATLDGACLELCTSSAAACATPGHVCMLQPGDVMGTCLAPCDPLEPGCDELEGCYTFGLGPFGCAPDGSGNAGTYGDECVWATDCEPGLTCLLAPH